MNHSPRLLQWWTWGPVCNSEQLINNVLSLHNGLELTYLIGRTISYDCCPSVSSWRDGDAHSGNTSPVGSCQPIIHSVVSRPIFVGIIMIRDTRMRGRYRFRSMCSAKYSRFDCLGFLASLLRSTRPDA